MGDVGENLSLACADNGSPVIDILAGEPSMKGFPNQVSNLETLAAALKVFSDLMAEAQEPQDDGVFGEALIRRGVLRTGHKVMPVDEYIAQQKAKKGSSYQSFRTSARGLRELFRVLRLQCTSPQ